MCRSWKISIPNLKKSLSHCQGFIQDFELGEGGNFHVLAKGWGGGGGGGEKCFEK